MNLLETLSDELKGKHYIEFEKTRHIYLRTCDIFSFDSRWRYAKLFNDEELLKQIHYKKFNVENIDDVLVVCHSVSKYILKTLIEELTNLEVQLEEGPHTIITLEYGPDKWELDATLGDLARVKAGLKTNGFSCMKSNSERIVNEMDRAIGYSRHNANYFSNRIIGDTTTEKVLAIGKMLEESKCKYHYSDASFYYSFLSGLLNQHDLTYVGDNYDFNKLIQVKDEGTYFRICRNPETQEYGLSQIEREEYNVLKRTLKHE